VSLENFSLYLRMTAVVGIIALPIILLITIFHQRVKRSPRWYGGSRLAERFLQATLGGLVLALSISTVTELIFGIGSVFKGDWALLPGLWLLGFGVVWRYLRSARHH
jgi:hypothetical protein